MEAQFTNKWRWYNSLYAIAKGDITQFDTITAMPLKSCLTWLLFEKEKNEIELKQIKNGN